LRNDQGAKEGLPHHRFESTPEGVVSFRLIAYNSGSFTQFWMHFLLSATLKVQQNRNSNKEL
jgi:hypothetical protein